MFCRKSKSRISRRRVQTGDSATAVMSRGVVTIAICAGAGMWGYAMINLAS